MGKFKTSLVLEKVPMEPRLWVLYKDLIYDRSDGDTYYAKSGMLTDLASVPRFFWRLYPPVGKYDAAAVIHDAMYQARFPRKLADKVFLEACIACGVSRWRAKPMYRMVRWFGGSRYRKGAKRG